MKMRYNRYITTMPDAVIQMEKTKVAQEYGFL